MHTRNLLNNTMGDALPQEYYKLKPLCEMLMGSHSPKIISSYLTVIQGMPKDVLDKLHVYMLYPLVVNIKSSEIKKNYNSQQDVVDAMWMIIQKVTLQNYDMFKDIEYALTDVLFDKQNNMMIAGVPEELKLSIMRCLTDLVLNVSVKSRQKFLETQIPFIGQVIYVCVDIARIERLKSLRRAAIECALAHTLLHPRLLEAQAEPERRAADLVASILPGLLGALHDVALCRDNPGHALVVAALKAMHIIICVPMSEKYYVPEKEELSALDFNKLVVKHPNPQEDADEKPKRIPRFTGAWFKMAAERIGAVVSKVAQLRHHDHHKVRLELAVLAKRIIFECHSSMSSTTPLLLDVLMGLSKDEQPEVARYCAEAVRAHVASVPPHCLEHTYDTLSDNLIQIIDTIPTKFNTIESAKRLTALNMMVAYVEALGPQRVSALCARRAESLAAALRHAVSLELSLPLFTTHTNWDVTSPPPLDSPWARLRLLQSAGERRRALQLCRALGDCGAAGAGGAALLEALLAHFHDTGEPEDVYLMNHIASAPGAEAACARRVLGRYLDEQAWYRPLGAGGGERAPAGGSRDPRVYDPGAWARDCVPGLYEGAVEVRYTGVPYGAAPRAAPPAAPRAAPSPREARRNMAACCLLAEGVGQLAARLRDDFRPFTMRALCMLLERVGSEYELLHLAGLKALGALAAVCCGEGAGVRDLVRLNADYFTHQVTVRLRKAWRCRDALQVLTAVMRYSDRDRAVLDCLYAVVEDVLVQSCDKHYEKNLNSYLQVFLTFVNCIRKWFPDKDDTNAEGNNWEENDASEDAADLNDSASQNIKVVKKPLEIDLLAKVNSYLKSKKEMEAQLNNDLESEKGKSAEEMYREDQREREENALDYDDRVTGESSPLPRHVSATLAVLRRALHFVTARRRADAALALHVLRRGLPALARRPDELLPLVHAAWPPLVAAFGEDDPVLGRRALHLLLTMAHLAEDFITQRALKEVVPSLVSRLEAAAARSRLRDRGSVYRQGAAYWLQGAALRALPALARRLRLDADQLEPLMLCADLYLARTQPKPLQSLAVDFYKSMLEYDHGAAWHHLRLLCRNRSVLAPPPTAALPLRPVVGTPYETDDLEIDANIRAIFAD